MLSLVVLVLLANMVVYGSFWPSWRDSFDPIAEPAGVVQNWSMFARPPTRSVLVRADVEMVDGSTERWRPPGSGRALMTVRAERWRKWWVKAHDADGQPAMRSMAEWLGDRYEAMGFHPVAVRFVEVSRRTPSVGEAPPEWSTKVVRVVRLSGA